MQVTRLCDLSVEGDSVTSVGWSERVSGTPFCLRLDSDTINASCCLCLSNCIFPLQGNHVAVGTHKGFVQIWDAAAGKKLFTLEGHTARVGKILAVPDGT